MLVTSDTTRGDSDENAHTNHTTDEWHYDTAAKQVHRAVASNGSDTHVALLGRGRGADGTTLLASLHLITKQPELSALSGTIPMDQHIREQLDYQSEKKMHRIKWTPRCQQLAQLNTRR